MNRFHSDLTVELTGRRPAMLVSGNELNRRSG